MSTSGPMDEPSLTLSPDEKAVYGQLFRAADTESIGVVTGEVAVKFFEKSGVSPTILGQIWEISDKENQGFLTQQSFSIALRLIGQAQTGRQVDASLAKSSGPLPKFEGLNIDYPPSRVIAPQTPKLRVGMQLLTPEERTKYYNTWQNVNSDAELLNGERARDIFQKANLPNEQLGQIWNLTDTQRRGALDSTEFIVAMHLIQSCMNGSIKTLPPTLPPGLFEAASGGSPAARQRPSRQTSTSSQRGAEPIVPQYSGQAARQRPQLTGPPGRASPVLGSQHAGPPLQQAPEKIGWDVKSHEKANFDTFFTDIDTGKKGYVTGEEAAGFFMQSKLSEEDLAHIWDLSDMDKSGRLTRDAFAVAMYLIKYKLSGRDLPPTLPNTLIPPSMRAAMQSQGGPPQTFASNPQAAAAAPSSAAADLFGLNDSFAKSSPVASRPALGASTGSSATSPTGQLASPTSSVGTTAKLDMPPNQPIQASRTGPGQPLQTLQPTRTGFGGQPAFTPSSTFGQSIQQQQQLPQSQAQSVPQAPQSVKSTGERNLLDEADSEVDKKLTIDTAELANLSNQIGLFNTQNQQLKRERGQTEADVANLGSQRSEIQSELAHIRGLYDEEVKTVRALQAQQGQLRAETSQLTKDYGLLEASLGAIQSQHGELDQQLQKERTENDAIKAKIKSANDETARLKEELERLKKEAKQHRGLVAINTKQLITSEDERETIDTQITQEREMIQREKVQAAASREATEREKAQVQTQVPTAASDISHQSTRGAAASPSPSVASISTNPFHRVQSPVEARDRSLMSPFSSHVSNPQTPTFPFKETAAVGLGVGALATAGIGLGAGAIAAVAATAGYAAFEETKIHSEAPKQDGEGTAAHGQASQQVTHIQATDVREDDKVGDFTKQPMTSQMLPSTDASQSYTADANEVRSEAHIHAPQPVSMSQNWSSTDPFTADPRIASPALTIANTERQPLPTASGLRIVDHSGGSDDGESIATSVRAHAPTSVMHTPSVVSGRLSPNSDVHWNDEDSVTPPRAHADIYTAPSPDSEPPSHLLEPAGGLHNYSSKDHNITSNAQAPDREQPISPDIVQATLRNVPHDRTIPFSQQASATTSHQEPDHLRNQTMSPTDSIPGAFPVAAAQEILFSPDTHPVRDATPSLEHSGDDKGKSAIHESDLGTSSSDAFGFHTSKQPRDQSTASVGSNSSAFSSLGRTDESKKMAGKSEFPAIEEFDASDSSDDEGGKEPDPFARKASSTSLSASQATVVPRDVRRESDHPHITPENFTRGLPTNVSHALPIATIAAATVGAQATSVASLPQYDAADFKFSSQGPVVSEKAYNDLLPVRGDPMPLLTATSTVTAAAPASAASKAPFNDFDDFDDLEESRVIDDDDADQSYINDLSNDFNPSFDSPVQAQHMDSQTGHFAHNSLFDNAHSSAAFSDGSGSVLAPALPHTTNPQSSNEAFDSAFSTFTGSPTQSSNTPRFGDGKPSNIPPQISFPDFTQQPQEQMTQSQGTRPVPPLPPPSNHGTLLQPNQSKPALDRQQSGDDDPMLKELLGMGFSREKSVFALEHFNYNLTATTNWLLDGN